MPKNKNITPERTAHLYALMAWSDKYTKEQAEEIAYTTEYSELDNITWAETSINESIKGIKEKLLMNQYLSENFNWDEVEIENSEKVFDLIIEILQDIHDKWVIENAKKYNRGTEEKSNKNLFQHLPSAMIGIDEISKDLMFLAPFLNEMGLNAGKMELVPYGKFKPSVEIQKAYDRDVQKYKEQNNINSISDLDNHIKDCLLGAYIPLQPTTDIAKARLEYMRNHVELLSDTVMNKNVEAFGKLPTLTDNI